MKKILSWFLILAMLMTAMLAFTACKKDSDDGDGDEAENGGVTLTQDAVEDLLSTAGENMTDMDDINLRMSAKMTMSSQGMTMEIPVTFSLKMSDYRSANPAFAMTVTATVMGESMSYAAYYKDGWAYLVENGVGTKQQLENPFADLPTEMEPMPELTLDAETEQMLKDLWDDMLKNADAVTTANGVTTIEFDLTLEEILNAFVAVLQDESLSSILGSMDLGDMDFGDMNIDMDAVQTVLDSISGSMKMELTLQNDYVTGFAMDMSMSMTEEGVPMTYAFNFDVELVNPGKSVTVTLPAGAENFVEGSGDHVGGIPTDPDEAIAILENAGYTVATGDLTDPNAFAVSGSLGESAIEIFYFENAADAESMYEEAVTSFGDMYVFGLDDTVLWMVTSEDVLSVFDGY